MGSNLALNMHITNVANNQKRRKMASFQTPLSGLAGEIRGSTCSEQFDLSGYTETRVSDLVRSAFSVPLETPTEMVRFTFVVGGGKLVRSRYPEDLPKWMSAALRDIGFTEDRSAAETFDSQGTFKQQHDTGQNLKYLIVFPRVSCATTSEQKTENVAAATVDTTSPEYLVVACEKSTLDEIVHAKTTSWSQRKRLLKVLQNAHQTFVEIEQKLVNGMQLTSAEQTVYDSNCNQDDDKIQLVTNVCKQMVEEGQLTSSEKAEILGTMSQNIAGFQDEMASAQAAGNAKRVEKLQEKLNHLADKKRVLESRAAIVHRLRHSEDIQKVQLRLLALHALEEKGRSLSLTLADLKALEEKSDLEDRLKQLTKASRGWFESDEEFEEKLQLDLREAARKYAERQKKSTSASQSSQKSNKKQSASAQRPTSSVSGVSTSHVGGASWGTIGMKKPTSSSKGSKSSEKEPTGKTGGGFAAAFGDSDSD